MYKYETHLHTYPVSRCAKASVRDNLEFYKKLGYDGVFITNHFVDGNFFPDLPYEERIERFFDDYEEGVKIGREIGIKVFCGIENDFGGTHFLVYGLEKEWYLQHPEILTMPMSQRLELFIQEGAFVVHAHPFRYVEKWIDHVRLFPKVTQGVEVYNACRDKLTNNMALLYAENFGMLQCGGTDNHRGEIMPRLGGVETDTPIEQERDLKLLLETGHARPFRMENPLIEA